MLKSYICKRCNYKTNNTIDICDHFRGEELCTKLLENYCYSDDYLLISSLLPHKKTQYEINIPPNCNLLLQNIKEYIDLVEHSNKSKCKLCKYCNESFDKVDDYRIHVIKDCFYNELLKRNETDKTILEHTEQNQDILHDSKKDILSSDNKLTEIKETNISKRKYNKLNKKKDTINENLNNITTETNTLNNNLKEENGKTNDNTNNKTNNKTNVKFNININDMNGNNISSTEHKLEDENLDIDDGLENIINGLVYKMLINHLKRGPIPVIPFSEMWDTSDIDFPKAAHVFMNKFMYSTLLKVVLENDKNLNIIFDEEKKTGLMYINDEEKYIKLTASDIVDCIMLKLKNELLQLLEVIKPEIFDKMYVFLKDLIVKRHQEYLKEDVYKGHIINNIISLYNHRRDESIQYFNIIQP